MFGKTIRVRSQAEAGRYLTPIPLRQLEEKLATAVLSVSLSDYGFNVSRTNMPPGEPWGELSAYSVNRKVTNRHDLPKESVVVGQFIGPSPRYDSAPEGLGLVGVVPADLGRIALRCISATTLSTNYNNAATGFWHYLENGYTADSSQASFTRAVAKLAEVKEARISRAASLVTSDFLARLPDTASGYSRFLNTNQAEREPEEYRTLTEAASYVGLPDLSDDTRRYREELFSAGTRGWQQLMRQTEVTLTQIHADHTAVLAQVARTGRFEVPIEDIDYGRPYY